MKQQYTKHQILEAIKHWKSILKKIDESKSLLLDVFAEKFGEDVVFSNKCLQLSNHNVKAMFEIFNVHLFDSKLNINEIMIECLSYDDMCKMAKSIYNKYKRPTDDEYISPPQSIYGMHFAIALNDIFTYDDPLIFANEEVIFLNMSKINNKSFSLQAASLCHEMIHYYDRLFGEYESRYKTFFISKIKPRLHDTPTFERKMKEANDNYIDVVKYIPNSQTPDQSDEKAVKLALQALKESENGMPCIIEQNTPEVQLVGNRHYIVIQDF